MFAFKSLLVSTIAISTIANSNNDNLMYKKLEDSLIRQPELDYFQALFFFFSFLRSPFTDTQGRGDAPDENSNQEEEGSPWQHLPDHLKEAILHLSSNIGKVKSDQKWCLVRALVCFFLLLLSLSLGSVSQLLAFVWTCGLTLLTAFYLGFGLITKECEKKTLTGIMEGMKVRLGVVENRMTVNGDAVGKHI